MTSYGPSRLDGYDFTRIKLFCDQYYQSAIAVFSAYHHAGGLSITSASTANVAYDNEVRKDNVFSHSINTAGVTVAESGLYQIMADLSVDVSAGSTASYVSVWLMNNSTEIPGSRTYLYTPSSGSRASGSINRLLTLSAGDIIKVQAQLSASGNTVATVADSARLTLLKFTASFNPSTSGNGSSLDFSQADNSAFIPFS